ncbi:MAG: alpha/beta hydrolase [Thermoanaerobaculia bacterium]
MTSRDSARLMRVSIPGPAGLLEGLLRSAADPLGAAVVAHPHPLHGGTMHTKVVHSAAHLLSDEFGLATLRFNFRSVGASAGEYAGGPGETEDLVAAARWLRGRVTGGPLVLCGFSFGSVCALHAASVLTPDLLFLIGLPTRRYRSIPSAPAGTRVFWIQGEDDEYSRPERARSLAESRFWDFVVIPRADHLFTARLDAFEEAAAEGLRRALEGRSM